MEESRLWGSKLEAGCKSQLLLQNSLPFDAFGIQHPDFESDPIFEQGDKILLDSSVLVWFSGHPDFGSDSIFEQGDKTLLNFSVLIFFSGQQLTFLGLVLQY